MTQQLLMLKGLPASGKTTKAKELVDTGHGSWVRVNKDDLRKLMDNGVHSKENEQRIIRTRNSIIFDALANGRNVVVDDTNFAPVHAETLKAIADQFEAEFKVTFMNTPLEVCLERNAARENPVPAEVIQHMYDKYIKPPTPPLPEGEPYNDNLEEAIIVDVDGTLAHIDPNNPRNVYDASRAMEDILDDAVASIVSMAYDNGYKVIILTGRHSGHLPVTKQWLEANGINYDEIYSRREGDKTEDTVIKEALYEEHIKGKYNVKFVIDDRPSVCRMWRSIGLKTLQVGDPHVEF